MADVKVELNIDGFNELRHDPELVAQIQSIADAVASTAGEGHAVRMRDIGTRVVADVYAETEEAVRRNLEDNVLLTALGGAGE